MPYMPKMKPVGPVVKPPTGGTYRPPARPVGGPALPEPPVGPPGGVKRPTPSPRPAPGKPRGGVRQYIKPGR